MKVTVAVEELVPLPLPAGVALYAQVGDKGGGGDGGGGEGGGGEGGGEGGGGEGGGREGGWQKPSQSTMYSTYT